MNMSSRSATFLFKAGVHAPKLSSLCNKHILNDMHSLQFFQTFDASSVKKTY